MTVHRDELIKQAYAHGAAIALREVGVDEKVAADEAAAFTHAKSAQSHNVSALQKRAYFEGISLALQQQGLDEKTAEATALNWINNS